MSYVVQSYTTPPFFLPIHARYDFRGRPWDEHSRPNRKPDRPELPLAHEVRQRLVSLPPIHHRPEALELRRTQLAPLQPVHQQPRAAHTQRLAHQKRRLLVRMRDLRTGQTHGPLGQRRGGLGARKAPSQAAKQHNCRVRGIS